MAVDQNFWPMRRKKIPSIHPLPIPQQKRKWRRKIHYLITLDEFWRLKRQIQRLVVDLLVDEDASLLNFVWKSRSWSHWLFQT